MPGKVVGDTTNLDVGLLPPQRFTKLKSSFPHLNPLATFPAPDKCTGRGQT
ncbi:MAG TPA: hypothetical protein VJL56_05030 [Candidatus Bathyarchaeia archaeon]|nr:hypothetical protein [Candidatus Bathyarchaeia archaeon]